MLGVRRTTHNLASPAANVGRPRRGWWQSAGRHRPTAGGQRRGTRRQARCGGRREPRWPLAEAKCGTGPVAAATGLAFPILRPLLGSRRPAGWQLVGVPRPPRDHPPAAPAGAARSPSRATPATAAFHLQATPPEAKAESQPRDGDRRGLSLRVVSAPACNLDRPCSTLRPVSAFHGQPRGHALYRGARRKMESPGARPETGPTGPVHHNLLHVPGRRAPTPRACLAGRPEPIARCQIGAATDRHWLTEALPGAWRGGRPRCGARSPSAPRSRVGANPPPPPPMQ